MNNQHVAFTSWASQKLKSDLRLCKWNISSTVVLKGCVLMISDRSSLASSIKLASTFVHLSCFLRVTLSLQLLLRGPFSSASLKLLFDPWHPVSLSGIPLNLGDHQSQVEVSQVASCTINPGRYSAIPVATSSGCHGSSCWTVCGL